MNNLTKQETIKQETIKQEQEVINRRKMQSEMKENLQQLFITLSEASKSCELELLPSITASMLEIYSVFRTI